jgi:hypothetical protein
MGAHPGQLVVELPAAAQVDGDAGGGDLLHGARAALDPGVDGLGLGEGGLGRLDGEAAPLDQEPQQPVAQQVELAHVVGALPDAHHPGVADRMSRSPGGSWAGLGGHRTRTTQFESVNQLTALAGTNRQM